MDNLFNSELNPNGEVPSYLLAADNHNIGNTMGGSWFDPETWSTKFSNAGKFMATSVLSGADSIYSSAQTVGSWAGISEGPTQDTGAWIAGIDDDLGAYYAANRESVDLAGFIVTSFVPGLAGIKLLNVGQKALAAGMASGKIGGNLAKATGLLVPKTALYVDLAASEISAASGAISTINANTVRALGSGVYKNALEGAAFEITVQATMFNSPILDQQDGWDIAKNVALGAALGGVIGGAIDGARSIYRVKKLVAGETQAGKPFSDRFIGAEATPADQRIILTAEARDYRAVPIALEGEGYALGNSNATANSKLYANAVEKDNNTIRAGINSLTSGGDGTIGNMVADALYNAPAPQMMETMLHAAEITTLGGLSKIESLRRKALNALDIDQVRTLETRYVKLTGEGSGKVTDAAPLIANISDNVKTGANRTVRDAVLAEVKNYKFNTKELWDASALSGKTSHTAAEARFIWATHVLPEVKAGTTIHANDIPLLERVIADLDKGKAVDWKIQYADGSTGTGLNSNELRKHLAETKVATANKLLEDMVFRGTISVEQGTEAIAKIVNVKRGYLEGTVLDEASDLYARQSANLAHKNNLVSKGLRTEADEAVDTAFVPQYAKIGYKTKALEDLDGNVVDGMIWIKQQQKLFQDSADRVFAKNAGNEINSAALPVNDSVLLNANLSDGGAGLVSFANGNYGSLGSYMQQIGANVTRPLKEAYRKATAASFEGPLVAMGTKREAAIEFDIINNRIAATTEQYVIDRAGYSGVENALISKKIRDYNDALAAGAQNLETPVLQKGAAEFIEVQNKETFDTISAHIDREGSRVQTRKEINAALGKEDMKELDIFRPLRPNPDDYPFFAFVKDQKVTGAGHTSMIHANTEAELRALVDKVPTDQGYKVIYKDQAEEYYKARGEFEYSRTLHENYVDSALKSNGINSQFFTKTDPQKIVDDILRYHTRADDVTAVELVRMKYQPAFDWLEDQGKQFSSVQSSQYGNTLKKVEKFGKNPYTDYTKTALDVSKASEYTLLYSANKELDRAVSVVYNNVAKMFADAKSPAELGKINQVLESHGINSAYNSAAADALINHTAPKAVLSKFVRTSNAILAKFTLMLDPLNGVNNAIGANILRFTELKNIDRAIAEGNTEVAGALAKKQRIGLPGLPPDQTIQSSTKLVANSIRNFFADTDNVLLKQYQQEGLVKDTLNQFRDMLDDFTLRGTESVSDIDRRIQSGFARAKQLTDQGLIAGEKYTGNKFFEQFNRFISADVMRQKTDAAEALGLLTPAESKAYRNTFVNRVEGNTIASQRPVMFQGPIGQAVGLFQSYQFNLMQQLFRYVGEGTGKDAAMLLGLQGTMYGLNGMPAFKAINTHVVGNLSGNTNHTDLYDATYGIAGKTAGDFLMYGIPSSIIQTNLYSRGDINPRTLTIIPNQIENIPIVSAYSKLFGSLYETAGKINGGGNVWQSILQGVEHNGISRPLAGLAQTLQATTGDGVVFSTSNKGSIIGSNDFMSLATLSRLAGGRPLDEAIVNDGMYRIASYEAAQKKARDKLLETVKTTGIQGQEASMGSLDQFAEAYAATGGKQTQFNKFMLGAYKSANTSQSEKILQQLQNPFNQKMQILMGGRNDVTSGVAEQESDQEMEESQEMEQQRQQQQEGQPTLGEF